MRFLHHRALRNAAEWIAREREVDALAIVEMTDAVETRNERRPDGV
jgi:hypothetical protein